MRAEEFISESLRTENPCWKGYKPDHDRTSWARTLDFFNRHLGGAAEKKAAAAG